jgi:transposase InsO family protein
VLAVVDAYTRECLSLEVDTSLLSRRATRSLEAVVKQRGMPESIRCDNGPELTSRHSLAWCEERKIQLIHIQPGRPMQNPYVTYCTSLDDCEKIRCEAARSRSLMPCCFRGGLSSGS